MMKVLLFQENIDLENIDLNTKGNRSSASRFWHATLCRKDCRRTDRYWWATSSREHQRDTMVRRDACEPHDAPTR